MKSAARIAIAYALIASLWILVSDELLNFLVPDPQLRAAAGTIKGGGFVLVTALILFALLKMEFGRRARVVAALERYQALAANTNDIMLFLDEQSGKILEANQAAVQAYGLPREELLQKTISDLRHDSTLEQLAPQMKLASGQGAFFETVHCRGDGSPFPVEVSSQGITIGSSRVLLSIIRDISERKAAEAAQRRLAEERDRLLARLNGLNEELEQRVLERTAELSEREAALRVTMRSLSETATRLQASQEQLRGLAQRRADAQERERAYVANQLYNEAAQVLAVLQIQHGRLEHDLAGGSPSPQVLAEMKATVDRVLSELHHLAVHLHPVVLDRLGLAPALEQYLAEFARTHGLKAQFVMTHPQASAVPPEIAIVVYRIAQEALTNVALHARATTVGIVVSCAESCLSVILEDDGAGFDVDEALRRGALGLISMREQAQALGGHLEVESNPGAGTTVVIEVPLPG